MSHDLFGAVAAGAATTSSARSRKSTLVIVSAGAHALAILIVSAVQLGHIDRWPAPRQVLAYYDEPRLVKPGDIELPRARPRSSPASDAPRAAPDVTSVSSPAPLTAPTDVTTDTSRVSPTGSGPGGSGVNDRDTGAGGIPDNIGVRTGPPAAPPAIPVRLHSGIRAPEKIVHVAPVYPPLARASRVQGLVIIEATVDVRGHVESARVLRSIALLDQAALDAVTQWTFSPTLLNGVAVPIIMTVTVNFKLE